jgi:hypothetical protein
MQGLSHFSLLLPFFFRFAFCFLTLLVASPPGVTYFLDSHATFVGAIPGTSHAVWTWRRQTVMQLVLGLSGIFNLSSVRGSL